MLMLIMPIVLVLMLLCLLLLLLLLCLLLLLLGLYARTMNLLSCEAVTRRMLGCMRRVHRHCTALLQLLLDCKLRVQVALVVLHSSDIPEQSKVLTCQQRLGAWHHIA